MNRQVIIIYGPPSSGKGTQARLLSDKLGFFNFDTGALIRDILYDPQYKNNKEVQREKILNEAGKLCTPSWVFQIVSRKVEELNRSNQSIIFSGSPRTLHEAFGFNENNAKEKVSARGQKENGLFSLLEKFYGKENIHIFQIIVSEKEVVQRNKHRLVCSVCDLSFIRSRKKLKTCPFCGGSFSKRKDDKKGIIFERLKEYEERTAPIFQELKRRKYKITKIDGSPLPYKIHQKILSHLQ